MRRKGINLPSRDRWLDAYVDSSPSTFIFGFGLGAAVALLIILLIRGA